MKKTGKIIIILAAVIAVIAIALSLIKRPKKIDGFNDVVTDISGITISEETRLVALGEATHGNKEFQELKLDVFRHLVETDKVRGLILEGDFGGCAIANRYIQGGEGTAEEVTKLLGYRIYRTDSMCELIQWMHDYNASAAENDKVRLYGADIQNSQEAIRIVKDFYESVDAQKYKDYSDRFDTLFGTQDDSYSGENYDEIAAFLDELDKDMEDNRNVYCEAEAEDEFAFETGKQAVYSLKSYMEYREKENFSGLYRDTAMSENVKWALGIEENLYGSKLMLSGHNGHMSKSKSTNYTFLGIILKEELGDAYFVIGTDFYITHDNLPENGKRVTKRFCSDDVLAYQAKYTDYDKCYLDFSRVPKGSEISTLINNRMPTGSLGEDYSPLYRIMKSAYQINYAPSEIYDAMIYVYKATPIKIWE